MNYKSFLIKYAEIGVKGKNRYLFEDALVKQINNRLKRHDGGFLITKEQGRIYAEASEEYDFDEIVDSLQHVFGIVGICPMVQVEKGDYESLKESGGIEFTADVILGMQLQCLHEEPDILPAP